MLYVHNIICYCRLRIFDKLLAEYELDIGTSYQTLLKIDNVNVVFMHD